MTLGRVEPRAGEIKITAPMPGRIADVLVKANENVFAGQLLVRLDDEEARARVAEAEAQVALHKRARNDQSAPAASAERRKAEDAAADAENATSPTRESALDKTTAEWRAGGSPKADLDAARAALSRAQDPGCTNGRIAWPNSSPPPTRRCRPAWKASSTSPRPNGAWRGRAGKDPDPRPADGVVLQVDAKIGESRCRRWSRRC